MITLRIVEIENNQFAIQSREGWSVWRWCDLSGWCHWSKGRVWDYCVANTLEQVNSALEVIIMDIKKRRKPSGEPKIIRIIKTVKV